MNTYLNVIINSASVSDFIMLLKKAMESHIQRKSNNRSNRIQFHKTVNLDERRPTCNKSLHNSNLLVSEDLDLNKSTTYRKSANFFTANPYNSREKDKDFQSKDDL